MAPSPQAFAEVAASAMAEEVIVRYAPEYLAQRANAIHSALPKITQTKTTTAIAEVIKSDGSSSLLVASSENRLRPAQIEALKLGETPVSGAGHAEATIINNAASSNQQVVQVAASMPICANCATAIQSSGATTASPLKAVKTVQSASPYLDPSLK